MRRGRPILAVISGLLWGLGVAVLASMYGLTTLGPVVLYGVTGGAAVLSFLWSRHRSSSNAAPFVAIALLMPAALWAQTGGCEVGVEPPGTLLGDTSLSDPLTIDPDDEETVTVFVWTEEPVEGANAEIWLEIGGVKVPLRSGSITGNEFVREFDADELLTPFGVLPGLHHVGGSIEDTCEIDGYVRVLGNPLTNPVGIAAAAFVVVGLAGTWFAGGAALPLPTEPSAIEPKPTSPPPEPPPDVAPPPDMTPRDVEPPEEEAAGEEESSTEQPATPPVETRWLQARIFGDGPQRTPLNHFRPDTDHDIEVRIGPEELGWLTGTAPFPDEQLPGGGPHRLTVLLTEPNLLRTPQAARIILPGSGASTTAWFELTTRADTASVDARLTVLYGNRVLHTARLPHHVGEIGDGEQLTVGNVAEVESIVHGTGELEATRPFDAAFIVNHDDQGVGRVTGIADGAGREVDLTDREIADAIELVTARLGEIVEQPADFEAIDAPGTVELLTYLARHGSMLRQALVGEFLDTLAGAARLQVVSAREDAYFPFEFAYDFESPRQEPVEVCPVGRQMLIDGGVGVTCPGPHGHSIVCPMGFWGLSKTIERRTFQEHSRLNPRFFVSSQPMPGRDRITLGAGSVFAASDRVDAFSAGSIGRVAAAMAAASAGHSLRADSWEQWTADVATRRPSLLVLLPHTVFDDNNNLHGLEIGDHDRRLADEIDEEFVPPEEQPAIVALLGCETVTSGPIDYERFPRRFRQAGAEIVLGTITEVLGRHAGPIAERLVSTLHEEVAGGASTVGEVIVVLRRRLLAEGIPAVLAVTAFGDAEWIIEA
ncbi:MAG: hypothetical protein ABFS21_05245 [Actinomycetota bacterium]